MMTYFGQNFFPTNFNKYIIRYNIIFARIRWQLIDHLPFYDYKSKIY